MLNYLIKSSLYFNGSQQKYIQGLTICVLLVFSYFGPHGMYHTHGTVKLFNNYNFVKVLFKD